MTSHKKGFTLVELSIVLVIIGLLIGGVLKGQSMIENAKIKRFVTDVDALVSGVYSYQDKFNTLPGDDPSVGATATGAAACVAIGNGDGILNNAAEQLCAYQDMIQEGFLTGNQTGATEATVGRSTPFGSFYVFRFANVGGVNQNVIQMLNASVPDDVAQAIDTKYDDGDGTTGDIRTSNGVAYGTAATKNLRFMKF